MDVLGWSKLPGNAFVLCTAFLVLAFGDTRANAGTWEWATGPSSRDEAGSRDWEIDIVPYLWLAGLEGTIGLPPVGTIPVSKTFSSLSDNLDSALAGFLDARYRRWHLLVDGSWVRLKHSVVPSQPILELVELETSVAFGTAAVSYELPLDGDTRIELYLAARWWRVDASALVLTPGPILEGGITEVWADAIVGTRIRYSINEKWRVGLTADIGAGGADLDWQIFGFVGYRFNPHFGLTAGYRILGVDYSSQGFVYDVRQTGLLLGFNFAY